MREVQRNINERKNTTGKCLRRKLGGRAVKRTMRETMKRIMALLLMVTLLPFSDYTSLHTWAQENEMQQGKETTMQGENKGEEEQSGDEGKETQPQQEEMQEQEEQPDITYEDYTVGEDMQLQENKEVNNLVITSGTLDLNGYRIIVHGDVNLTKGQITIGSGQMICYGNFSKIGSTTVVMENINGLLSVAGDFLWKGTYYKNTNKLIAGTIKIGKNFVSENSSNGRFQASGAHRVVFNGEEQQTIEAASGTYFQTVEIENTSSQGVVSSAVLPIKELKRNGNIITYNVEGESFGWTLQQDEVINGELCLVGGALNLNGHTLTVEGDLILAAGTICVGNGNLSVKGNFYQELKIQSSEGNGYGTLVMEDEEGIVTVDGNYLFCNDVLYPQNLTAGSLQVKGDFTTKNQGGGGDFISLDSHKLVLCGEGKQNVKMDNGSFTGSRLSGLVVDNTSNDNICLLNTIYVEKSLQSDRQAPQGNICIGADTMIHGEKLYADIKVGKNKTLTQNIALYGNLTLEGNVLFKLNTYTLEVYGDCNIVRGSSNGGFVMNKAEDRVLVTGDFVTDAYNYSEMSAGILELQGDFYQNYRDNFKPSGSHKTILSGKEKQNLYFISSGSGFCILELTNTSQEGIFANRPIKATHWIQNNVKVTYAGVQGTQGYTLEQDKVLEDSLYITGGELNLAGHTLEIKGDLIVGGGTLNINGGTLIVRGDMRIQCVDDDEESGYGESSARLLMKQAQDKVSVDGDFVMQSCESSSGNLSAGILEVKGNIEKKNTVTGSGYSNFLATGTHRLLLSGDREQAITVQGNATMQCEKLEIQNKAGVQVQGTLLVNGSLKQNEEVLSDSNHSFFMTGYIKVGNRMTLENNGFCGNLNFYYTKDLREEWHIYGDVKINANVSVYAPMHVEGNLIFDSGDHLILQNAQIDISGDCIQNKSNYANGLQMTHDSDMVIIGGDYRIDNETTSVMTAGCVKVAGDFLHTRRGGNGFISKGTHKIILNGNNQQKVQINNEMSYIEQLVLENNSEEGIYVEGNLPAVSIEGDTNITYSDSSYVGGFTLTEDMELEELKLAGGKLDLNGHCLKVNGNADIYAGTLYIHGGELIVEGDLSFRSPDGSRSPSVLVMREAEDKVKVNGNFYIYSNIDAVDTLTDGVLYVKKDFLQIGIYKNFAASGNHKVVLNGEGQQQINFYFYAIDKSYFNHLSIENETEVTLDRVMVNGIVEDNGHFVKGTLIAGPNMILSDNTYHGDIAYNRNITIEQNMHVTGNITLEKGVITLNGHHVLTEGNFQIKQNNSDIVGVIMTDDNDYLEVWGGFSCYANSNTKMLTGKISCKGDVFFSNNSIWKPAENHEFVMNGENQQTLEIKSNQVCFALLEMSNTSPEGIVCKSGFQAQKLIRNTQKLTYDGQQIQTGITLQQDTKIEGDYVLFGGTLDLNGYKLQVSGDMIIAGGELYIHGGSLKVGGSLRIQNRNSKNGDYIYSESNGIIRMNEKKDSISVNGDFITQSIVNHKGYMTDGTLQVQGNVQAIGSYKYNINGTDNFTLVLNGSTIQELSLDNGNRVQNITFENTQGGVALLKECVVYGVLEDNCGKVSGRGAIKLDNIENLSGGSFSGNLTLTNKSTLTKDIVVGGTLRLEKDIHVNGRKLRAGSIDIYRGVFYVEDGMVTCESDMLVEVDGILAMQQEEGYVKVMDSFTITSASNHSRYLTAGTLEIQGDFYQNRYNNFIAGENHNTILSGKRGKFGEKYIQMISFAKVGSCYFGTLILTKNKDSYYYFENEIEKICKKLQVEVIDDVPPAQVENICIDSVDSSSVRLSWLPCSEEDEVKGYDIYRNGSWLDTTTMSVYRDAHVKPCQTYTYTIYAYDAAGNYAQGTDSETVVTPQDTQAPAKPVNLHVTKKTGSSVTLSWSRARDNVKTVGYMIYRNGEEYDYVEEKTSFKDTKIEKDIVYTYTIKAKDEAGNISEESEELLTCTAQPRIISVTPEDEALLYQDKVNIKVYYMRYSQEEGNKIRMSYSEDGENFKAIMPFDIGGEEISYREGCGSYQWDISGLESGKYYIVRVILIDEDGNETSEDVTYYVDKSAPKEVRNLQVTPKEGVAVCTWEATDSVKCKGYKIYRRGAGESDYTCIGETNKWYETNYKDTGVSEGEQVSYGVCAFDAQGRESNLQEVPYITMTRDTLSPTMLKIQPGEKILSKRAKIVAEGTDNKELDKFILTVYREKDSQEKNHPETGSQDKNYQQNNSQETENQGNDNQQNNSQETDNRQENDNQQNDREIINVMEKQAEKEKAEFTWDTTECHGKYILSCVAVDTNGNKSEPMELTCQVDNQGPKPLTLKPASVYANHVTLEWEEPEEENVSFVVEQQQGEVWKKVGETKNTLGYHVLNLQPDTDYVFRVTPYDEAGNGGESSQWVYVHTNVDEQAPVIIYAAPLESAYQGRLTLEAQVKDNAGNQNLLIEYSHSKNGESLWETLADVSAQNEKKETHYTWEWNTDEYPEGEITIRFTAKDNAGNVSQPYEMTYNIDRTGPQQIANLAATAGEGSVELTWNAADEEVEHYNIYRKENETGGFVKIEQECTDIYYSDISVEPGKEYIYQVTATDIAGNESEPSQPVSARADEDTQLPVIKSFFPKEGSFVGGKVMLEVLATDNVGVQSLFIQIRKKGDDAFITLPTETVDGQIAHAQYEWNTAEETQGDYEIRFVAEDASGNVSEEKIITYHVDKTAPRAGDVRLTESNYRIKLQWDACEDEDFAGYEIYRKSAYDEAWESVGETQDTDYTDKEVIPDIVYFYKIGYTDNGGNQSTSRIVSGKAKAVDDERPKAVLADSYVAIAGVEIGLDGSLSTDNIGIVKYQWNMGNGDILIGKRPTYTYEEEGEYNITLTVWDKAGNKQSAKRKIVVYGRDEAGRLRIQLVNEYGEPISNAYVYQYLDNGSMLQRSDSNGYANIDGIAGMQKIAIYKEGYKSIDTKIKITPLEHNTKIIVMEEGALAKTEIQAHKMSYAEIMDSTIDLGNAENYEIFRYRVTFTFQKEKIPTITNLIVTGGEKKSVLKIYGEKDELGDIKTGAYLQPVKVGQGEKQEENLVIIRVSGGASWLKDFYQIDYGFINLLSQTFIMQLGHEGIMCDDNGLTIMRKEVFYPTEVKSGEGYFTTAYARGDKPGNYKVRAAFSGGIKPINEPFFFEAHCEDAINITSAQGLKFYVDAPSACGLGEKFIVNVTARNESEKVLNGMTLYVDGENRYKEEFTPGDSEQFTIEYEMPQGEEGEEGEYYFKMISQMVEILEGENTGAEVVLRIAPVYIAKIREEILDLDNLWGDPVDITTGAFVDSYEAISVTGGSELSFDLDYNSLLCKNEGTMGYGWSNQYDVKLKDAGDIVVTWRPGVTSLYKSEDREKVYIGVENGELKSTIVKNEDGTYILTLENAKKYLFDKDGNLTQVTQKDGSYITINRIQNVMEVTEGISGKKISVCYNAEGMVTHVIDENGRKTSFTYTDRYLTEIENPLHEKTKYTYDEKGRLEEIIKNNTTQIQNTYDENNRVVSQDDGIEETPLMTYEYEELGSDEFIGDYGMIVTVTDRNGAKTMTQTNCFGKVRNTTDANGNTTRNYYDCYGNLTAQTDANGYNTFYEYDKNGYCTMSQDAYGSQTFYKYDTDGNVTSICGADGNAAYYQYNKKNQMIYSKEQGGKETIYEYNDQGKLVKETIEGLGCKRYEYTDGLKTAEYDMRGNVQKYEYDNIGNMIKKTDREGNITTYDYDELRRNTQVTDALGNTETYEYDVYGNILCKTNSQGGWTTYTYDYNQKMISKTSPEGRTDRYTYDCEGNLLTHTNPDGTSTSMEYDLTGNLVMETNEEGNSQSYEYDNCGDVIKEIDANGNETVYEYYPNGKLQAEYDKNGGQTLYTYNQNWQLITTTYPDGGTITYEYDTGGNVKSICDGEGNITKYTYDIFKRCLSEIDANGNKTSYTYDANGNCIQKTLADGQIYRMEYDRENRLIKTTTFVGEEEYTIQIVYDALGREVKTIDEEGNTQQTVYDSYGNITAIIDGEGNVIQENTYDGDQLLADSKDGEDNLTVYSYNENGQMENVSQQVSGREVKTTYHYNAVGNLRETKDALAGTSGYTYDKMGNITGTTNPNGGVIRYEYDALGNMVSEEEGEELRHVYTYDSMSRVKTAVNARGQETTYTYDGVGRIVTMEDEEGCVTYTYDANGNTIGITDEKGTIQRTYDKRNRMISQTDYKGNIVSYGYDEIGNLISLTYPGGEIVRYTYYKNGNLKTITDNNKRTTSYTYDKANRLTACDRPDGSRETYTYDKAGRLVEKTDAAGEEILSHVTYEYDEAGNIISQTGDTANAPAAETITMEYNDNNRLIRYNEEEVQYDADGNMTYGPVDGQMTNLVYDCRNRLVQVGETTYEYNSQNERIAKRENGIRTEYTIAQIEGQDCVIGVEESLETEPTRETENTNINEDSDQVKQNNETTKQDTENQNIKSTLYVYGNGLVSETDSDNGYRLYHFNHLGSTVCLTDEKGNVTQNYTYGTYGELTGGDVDGTRYLYQGRYGVEHESNGLYYMRTRYYNVSTKRFLNRDIMAGSISSSPSLNRYSYVEGNPVTLTDPFGLCPSINFTNLGHNILDWVGMIPVLGEGADLINAYWYFKEGNTAYGASSILCAMPGMGTLIGSSTKIMKKVPTLGKILSKSCLMVGNGAYMAEAGIVGSQMIDSYLIKGENFNASEFAVQSMSIVGGLIAGVGISKQVKELRKSKTASKIRNGAKQFWHDNKGMVDLRKGNKSGSGSFTDMMSPEEAARYNRYWSQGTGSYQGVKVNGKWEKIIVDGKYVNTRQRMYTNPGTRSIMDVKLGNKGEMYYRETIFDEFGRKIGHNDYTNHGRPDISSHTNPHYHPNPVNNPSQHGSGIPGLHPQTPR